MEYLAPSLQEYFRRRHDPCPRLWCAEEHYHQPWENSAGSYEESLVSLPCHGALCLQFLVSCQNDFPESATSYSVVIFLESRMVSLVWSAEDHVCIFLVVIIVLGDYLSCHDSVRPYDEDRVAAGPSAVCCSVEWSDAESPLLADILDRRQYYRLSL